MVSGEAADGEGSIGTDQRRTPENRRGGSPIVRTDLAPDFRTDLAPDFRTDLAPDFRIGLSRSEQFFRPSGGMSGRCPNIYSGPPVRVRPDHHYGVGTDGVYSNLYISPHKN